MNNTELVPTSIKIYPDLDLTSHIRARVKVILNDSLVLNGMKIIKGQFGHFLSFPNQEPGSPFKIYDVFSFRLRKSLQNRVLEEYIKVLSSTVPYSG